MSSMPRQKAFAVLQENKQDFITLTSLTSELTENSITNMSRTSESQVTVKVHAPAIQLFLNLKPSKQNIT